MNLDADYVIVGAGSAGAALAARLSEDPSVSVLLLEAGGPDKAMELHVPAAFSTLFRGRYDWNYDTVPQAQAGGSHRVLAAGQDPRRLVLAERDDVGARVRRGLRRVGGCRGEHWSWDALVPSFRRAERTQDAVDPTQGIDGAQPVEHQRDPRPHTAAFLRAADEAGYPVTAANLPRDQGFSQTMVTHRRGARASTADAYLRPARRRRNLTVVTGALVRRVTFARSAEHAPRATGVYVDIAGVTRHARARREVILCGGAVNTRQLAAQRHRAGRRARRA
ncbi:GMC family oxidoreductase N-terminal domain-containing protein [Microbacterium elymi]|uniref:GMC family oxidoreductase N-terminal domain-containing protein n=1 Tax=Microbacterium elymi TaxID=2909587 RepID=A0ABY5NH20_9MICO|nr:GMC family oxidoreductase N-terminal domain-containing protein [Microbacterium elymi]UUT34474.1 GMC family oxidoreductase N-terminal domain-containing protein [Microbacterium elymi]